MLRRVPSASRQVVEEAAELGRDAIRVLDLREVSQTVEYPQPAGRHPVGSHAAMGDGDHTVAAAPEHQRGKRQPGQLAEQDPALSPDAHLRTQGTQGGLHELSVPCPPVLIGQPRLRHPPGAAEHQRRLARSAERGAGAGARNAGGDVTEHGQGRGAQDRGDLVPEPRSGDQDECAQVGPLVQGDAQSDQASQGVATQDRTS
jgi:hypothetical protein